MVKKKVKQDLFQKLLREVANYIGYQKKTN